MKTQEKKTLKFRIDTKGEKALSLALEMRQDKSDDNAVFVGWLILKGLGSAISYIQFATGKFEVIEDMNCKQLTV